jgi:Integrase core domain
MQDADGRRVAFGRLWSEQVQAGSAGARVRRPRSMVSVAGTTVIRRAMPASDHLVAGHDWPPSRLETAAGRPLRYRPELTANALRLVHVQPQPNRYIERRLPWQNPWVERFGGRLRDGLLAVEAFHSVLEVRVLVAEWRVEHITVRPHNTQVLTDLAGSVVRGQRGRYAKQDQARPPLATKQAKRSYLG